MNNFLFEKSLIRFKNSELKTFLCKFYETACNNSKYRIVYTMKSEK